MILLKNYLDRVNDKIALLEIFLYLILGIFSGVLAGLFGIGGGIVWDSNAKDEWNEAHQKSKILGLL